MKKHFDLLQQQKLLPLYYHENEQTSLLILKALYKGGVRILEYTDRGNNALENFKALKKTAVELMPDLSLGIGTIKSRTQALKFIEAGADFLVSPSINHEIAEVANQAGILWIPGCMTPTEIATAENLGIRFVKIFPGNILSPAYVNTIKEVFPEIKFMVTGGVDTDEQNLRKWFQSGVTVVGMGSKLIHAEEINRGEFESLSVRTAALLKTIREIQL